ncbi:MAG: hypothetical protein ABI699_13040 [Caldimonas sp.]
MRVAISSVHFGKGFFPSNGESEYGLALLATTVVLLISGGRRLSLGRALARGAGARTG